jgi:hypothetical protein
MYVIFPVFLTQMVGTILKEFVKCHPKIYHFLDFKLRNSKHREGLSLNFFINQRKIHQKEYRCHESPPREFYIVEN